MSESLDRRQFLKGALAASAAAAVLPSALGQTTQPAAGGKPGKGLIWGNLLHLSYNMWCDWDAPAWKNRQGVYRPYLRCDLKMWHELIQKMAAGGMNMLVIDLGDGVQYESHPEIPVKGAWSREQLREELAGIRKLGIEPIPKMNFSAGHDAWLGKYSKCVSTDVYYNVCGDLIKEAIKLFDKPRFFHLGMDEETFEHQRDYEYALVRQHDLWWRDFNFLCEQVSRNGSRPWIWSDYLWHHPELFWEKMPKQVLQSNWYYGEKFDDSVKAAKAYVELEQHGYEQIPTGSNWTYPTNFAKTVEYCRKNIDAKRLFGFLQTPWQPTIEECRKRHEEAIDQVIAVIRSVKA